MAKRGQTKGKNPARPIKTKRDHEAATAVVKSMSGQADQDSAAERRMQALLRELDKYEESDDYASADSPEDEDYLGPRRRWSDD
jgi:hypothetical protein